MGSQKSIIKILGIALTMCFISLVFFEKKVMAEATTYGCVTASSLHVRKSYSSSSSSLGKVTKGTVVAIYSSKKDKNNEKWYKVGVSIAEKSITGYVHSDYVEKIKTYSYVKRTGVVNASTLNIRKSMSTSSAIVAKALKGTRVTIVGEQKVSGTKWVKITYTANKKTITGYTHSTYITRDKITVETTQYLFGVSNASNIPVYQKANTYTQLKAKVAKNQEVVISGSLVVDGVKWYKVKIKMNGTNVYGYLNAKYITKKTATVKQTESLDGKIIKETKSYKIASSVSKTIKKMPVNQKITVTGVIEVNGAKWYRTSFKISKKSYDAYVLASCVQLDADAVFEQSLSNFPSSYKAALRTLHEKYPEWKFVAVETNLDWNDVILNESKVGRNTIQSNLPKGGTVTAYSAPFSYLSTKPGAYNWETDTYALMDGTNWYTASEEVIAHYMDPRNNLTEDKIWQFEALAYDEEQNIDVVKKILNNTFMQGDFSVIDKATGEVDTGNYANTFMKAGKTVGASPYFLAARAKQELGVNGSGSVSGNYPGYPGIYNYYNIGANDSSTGGAIANGLKWASTGTTYYRPWTSVTKSILGGAQYIATSYINKGQNTLYLQKFNVAYYPYYSHQYMTNVKAPTSEAYSQYRSYSALNILDQSYVFYIPVYKNMPKNVCELPQSKGNPNSYIKTLTATYNNKTYSLTPTFNYMNTSYTLVVPNNVDQIKISGTPISKYATISGDGVYSLTAGKTTTITIKGIAQNGTTTTYTLKVSRLAQ